MKKLYCPKCGKELISLSDYNQSDIQICSNSLCRTYVKEKNVKELPMEKYCLLQDYIADTLALNENDNERYWLLLKQDKDLPMKFNDTKSALEKGKNSLSVVAASSLEDAVELFNKKYNVIKVTSEMVREISIKGI